MRNRCRRLLRQTGENDLASGELADWLLKRKRDKLAFDD